MTTLLEDDPWLDDPWEDDDWEDDDDDFDDGVWFDEDWDAWDAEDDSWSDNNLTDAEVDERVKSMGGYNEDFYINNDWDDHDCCDDIDNWN